MGPLNLFERRTFNKCKFQKQFSITKNEHFEQILHTRNNNTIRTVLSVLHIPKTY